VWLDPERTSPYKFYQFWINIDDRDVGRYLRFFTLCSRDEIESLERDVAERPQERAAQHALAREVTTRVHGSEQAKVAAEVSKILFAKGDPSKLSSDALKALADEVPFASMTSFTSIIDALVELKLAASKGAARRLVEQGGVSVNGRKVGLADPAGDALAGEYYLVKKGARDFGLIRVRAGET
jgi:tyrosyl-tRNA synthetase